MFVVGLPCGDDAAEAVVAVARRDPGVVREVQRREARFGDEPPVRVVGVGRPGAVRAALGDLPAAVPARLGDPPREVGLADDAALGVVDVGGPRHDAPRAADERLGAPLDVRPLAGAGARSWRCVTVVVQIPSARA